MAQQGKIVLFVGPELEAVCTELRGALDRQVFYVESLDRLASVILERSSRLRVVTTGKDSAAAVQIVDKHGRSGDEVITIEHLVLGYANWEK